MSDPQQQPFHIVPGGDTAAEISRLRAELSSRNLQEVAIAELGQAALTGVDLSILIGQACALVELALTVDHCRALEVSPGNRMIRRAAIGTDESFSGCRSDAPDDDAVGMVVTLSDEPVTFSTTDETRFNATHLRDAHGVSGGAGVAILMAEGVFGALIVYSKRQRLFEAHELTFLRWIANIIGQAVTRERSEAAVRRAETRLRQLIASALDAVITVDPDGRIVEWNPQAELVFGITQKQILGRAIPPSIVPERLRPIVDRLLDRHLGSRRIARGSGFAGRRLEGVARRATGEEFPVEITLVPFGSGSDGTLTAFIRDISERLRAHDALQQSERRFRTIVERSWSGVALLDASLRFALAGPSTQHLLGYAETELIGQPFIEFVHLDDRETAQALIEEVSSREDRDARGELRFLHKNGSWLWLEVYAQNLLSEPTVGALVVNYRDISQKKLADKQIEYQAYYDMLTGLPNRFLFRDRVISALALARRHGNGIAVLYLDIDHFKLINDSLGHTFGDLLLAHIGARLHRSVRNSDTISRFGGDEFSVLLLDVDSADHAAGVAKKILDCFSKPFHVGKNELYVAASVGVACYPSDGHDVESLLKCADSAMHRAKELGRAQVQLYTPKMNERFVRRLSIEQNLRHAIDRGEFELHYQPIYDRTRREVSSFEALLRWNDPKRGTVPPAEFIVLAEETGMIVPIGEWVLQTACRQLREWSEAGAVNLGVSVNVSAQQLQNAELVSAVKNAVETAGIDPSRLQIEITETIAVQTIDRSRRVLTDLKDFGASIAIDDFGTGQSSLIYLRRFPIDAVKLDKEFLRGVAEDETAAAVVRYVIGLAHALRLKVVAEGVETEEQYAVLRQYGCDLMQGYLFSRPIAASAVLPLLDKLQRPPTLEIPRPPV